MLDGFWGPQPPPPKPVRERRAKGIHRMHLSFGKKPGAKCADCALLVRLAHNTRTYFKCHRYGISASEASDWRLKWDACGLHRVREGDIETVYGAE